MKTWRLAGDQLRLEVDGSLYDMQGAVVFSAVVDGDAVDDIEPGKTGDAVGLRFSRYPATLLVVLEERFAQGLPYVSLKIRTQMGSTFPVSGEALATGHVVVGGTWYLIEPNSLEELRSILRAAGVAAAGTVNSLRAVLALKAAAARGGPVEDVLPVGNESTLRFVPAGDGVPSGVNATLYPYQLDGWRWLKFVIGQGIGGLLADEMGLGKTLQIISALSDCGSGRLAHVLVIAPGSLLENWRREIVKFAPALKAVKHQGSQRTGRYAELLEYDVVIASYDTAVRDLSLMKMIEWDVVILDEAQNIRNPDALRTKTVKSIPRKVGLAMTGTPMENRLADLWSIMDFVAPGYLGDLKEFSATYPESVGAAARLEPMVSPLMLRRRISEVARDLPKRIDIPEVVELSDAEANEYERIRKDIFDRHGKAATLVALTALRQFCAHPSILADSPSMPPGDFSKFARLQEILTEIAAEGDKALVFTSFIEMGDMIARHVKIQMGIFAETVDGRLAPDDRQALIDRFSAVEGPAVLVLNPRVGAAGLNITAATHVIHYNLEWNPALEDQASARAHRRGQTRPVIVRRLVCADTVEDVVNDRVESKRAIADAAIVGMQGREAEYRNVIAALERSPVGRGEGR